MIKIKFQSMTAKEYKGNCKTFQLLYGFHYIPFGKCLIAVTDTDENVAYLAFVDENEQKALEALKKIWPTTTILKDTKKTTTNIIEKIFHDDASQVNFVSVLMKGTEFQTKVWKSLTTIPRGTVLTYESVAQMIDNPKAAFPVGNAISKNYIAYIVPCHRVKGKNGSNKYAWGVERKEAILEYEYQQCKT
nr:PREDICTED: methylated-DNA--protein-cysteine methyltransferase [Linepithema humile]